MFTALTFAVALFVASSPPPPHVMARRQISYVVGPPPPINAPKDDVYVQISGNRTYVRLGKERILYACKVSTAAPPHPSLHGSWPILRMDPDPTWKPTNGTRAMWIRAGKPLPKGPIKAGHPRNELGRMRWYLGHPSIVCHGTNKPETIGQPRTRGCFAFANGDIVSMSYYLRRYRKSPRNPPRLYVP